MPPSQFLPKALIAAIATLAHAAVQADTVNATTMDQVQSLVDSATGPRTIVLPAGNHVRLNPIRLKSDITIQGNNTTLYFPPQFVGNAFVATGDLSPLGVLKSLSLDRLSGQVDQDLPTGSINATVEDSNGTDSTLLQITTVSGGSFQTTSPAPNRAMSGQTLFRRVPVSNVTIQGIRILGTTNPCYFDVADNVTVRNIVVTDSQNYMVFRRSSNVDVSNCVWERTGGGPFFLGCSNVSANNNVVTKHTRAGVFVRSTSNATVQDNAMQGIPGAVAFGGNGDGLTVAYSDNVLVTNNDIRHTSCYGMWILGSQQVTVQNNATTNCYTTSYYVSGSQQVTLRSNSSSTNAIGYGYTVINSNGINLASNVAYLVPRGFYCVDNFTLSLSGNRSVQTQNPDYFANNSN